MSELPSDTPSQLRHELEVLAKEIISHQPNDLLQYCANYFNNRLEEERRYARTRLGLPASTGASTSTMFASSEPVKPVGASANTAAVSGIKASGNDANSQLGPHDTHTPTAHELFGGFLRKGSLAESSKGPNAASSSLAPHLAGHGAREVPSPFSHTPRQQSPPAPASSSENHHGTETPTSPSSRAVEGETLFKSHFQSNDTHSSTTSSNSLRDTLLQFNAGRRVSVSAEAINPDQFENFTQRDTTVPTGELLQRLNKSVSKNFLFSNLDEDSLRLLLAALEDITVEKGHTIIKQGDEGDFFYIVETGEVEFFRDGQSISKAGPGASFGELALMYNAPRAATVVATEDCKLWRLDRLTFKKILLDKTTKKRNNYQAFLQNVPLLRSLGQYERTKLADALKTRTYEAGEIVVRQGDPGDEFFLIESGEAIICKEDNPTADRTASSEVLDKSHPTCVGVLHEGDYFGEIALLHDLPRQATVVATTKLRVACLGRQGFQRLLGPVLDTLRQLDPLNLPTSSSSGPSSITA